MKFAISSGPIDRDALRKSLASDGCGAFVVFEGWVRNSNEGRAVSKLEYEVYRPLAEQEGERVLTEALAQFDIADAACVHREGLLELGEAAVWAGTVAAHRDEAFRACRFIIDEIKSRLPIWKREYYVSGETHWVNCKKAGDAKQGGS